MKLLYPGGAQGEDSTWNRVEGVEALKGLRVGINNALPEIGGGRVGR